jgi:phage terminase large subunit GpA-like protein
MTSLLIDVRRKALRDGLTPPPRLRLSTWIEANIYLPEGTSAQAGRLRLWPWQREIADCISDPRIERVSMLKASRLGFTTLTVGAIGAFIANEPASILCLLPTESDCRDFAVTDLEGTFDASPILHDALSPDRAGGERDTLTSRKFPGGNLKLVASRSPRNLRRHAARVLIVDEADACEPTIEGDPIRLAERRTLTFPNRKLIIGSTPVFSETSAIMRAYEASDQRVFEIPCASCGAFNEVLWSHIVWDEGQPETAHYKCPHCESRISERSKPQMVAAGRWRATRPEVRSHAGFRLNSLVSLLVNASWAKLAAEFLSSRDDPASLQVFTNTVLAQPWSTPSIVDHSQLANRVEDFDLEHMSSDVLYLTMGVDVQDDRLECTIVGWARNSTAYVLSHSQIWGSFEDDATWDDLDDLIRAKWKHPLAGVRIGVDAAVIDCSDGDHFDRTINFCLPRRNRRVFAGKNLAGTRSAFAMTKNKSAINKYVLVGVDGIKTVLFDRMQRGIGLRFSKSLDINYFEQLASERRVVRYVRGQPVRRFERIGRVRNESLDCLVYAFAARQSIIVPFERREAELRNVELPKRSFVHLLAR